MISGSSIVESLGLGLASLGFEYYKLWAGLVIEHDLRWTESIASERSIGKVHGKREFWSMVSYCLAIHFFFFGFGGIPIWH
jgi:hypothetical protein